MLEVSKIKKIIDDDLGRKNKILEYKRYYDNNNDIKKCGVVPETSDPLRTADNRLSHNFHQLLVDEKAAYMFTYPVLFDIDNNKDLNKKVKDILGDNFESISQDLCIESSNTGIAWLHYWIEDDKKFNYAMVDTEQIIPKYSNTLKKELKELYRYYKTIEGLEEFLIFEYWTDKDFTTYKLKTDSSSYTLLESTTIKHTLGRIPFISFANNRRLSADLEKYKDQIDLYDKVISGFANDLEDIQQIIYILENYGGADLKEFTKDLKRYKTIKTESGAGGSSGSVKTLQIEIPVEARNIILDLLKKQIYESGQGLQQDTENFGNASGVALKFFYRKLELKSGFTETEFKKGFAMLIRVILKYLKQNEDANINQTYTRNMISNDLENSQIARNSLGIIPQKIILRNHPWVDDPEEAEKLLKEEEREMDPYENLNNSSLNNSSDGDLNEE